MAIAADALSNASAEFLRRYGVWFSDSTTMSSS